MVLVIALVGAALSGAVAWRETQRYKQEHGELFFAIEPKLATAGVAFVAAVIGWIASPIVLGFLVGYALYREALPEAIVGPSDDLLRGGALERHAGVLRQMDQAVRGVVQVFQRRVVVVQERQCSWRRDVAHRGVHRVSSGS